MAIISLAVALSSLSYNTWRNEVTERNRNIREAGFEIIVTLGELQQIVFFSHFDQDDGRGNPRAGWSRVLVLEDLAALMPAAVGGTARELRVVWSENWAGLATQPAAEQRISGAIDALRVATLEALAHLD